MASGKSTCLDMIRDALSLPCIDLDAYLEKRVGMSISEYVGLHGWDAFRAHETEILTKSHDLIPQNASAIHAVFACGGGAVLAVENRHFLAEPSNAVIWLNTPLNVILKRLESTTRPLLHNLSTGEVIEMYQKRLPLYQNSADHIARNTESVLDLIYRLSMHQDI